MVQPGLRSLHHLPMEAQATAMFSDAMRQEWLNPQGSQQLPMEFRAIGSVSLNSVWPTARPAKFATHRRNPSREGLGQQLGHIVTVSAGQDGGQGDSIGVCNQVMFTARFTPVRGIGSRCSPPPNFQTPGWPHYPQSFRVRRTSRSGQPLIAWAAAAHQVSAKPPASCHSLRRRQQVMPDPHSISFGKYFPGNPALQNKEDPCQRLPIVQGFSPRKAPAPRFRGWFFRGRRF